MALSKDEKAKLIAALLGDDDGGNNDAEKAKAEEERKKAEAEAEAAAKAKAEEEAAEKARLEAEKAKAEENGENGNNDEEDELKKLKLNAIKADLKSGLKDKELDTEYFNSIDEFIRYDKMEDEAGNADPKKVEALVSALTSIALRNPPSGGAADYDPNNQGIGKYLK